MNTIVIIIMFAKRAMKLYAYSIIIILCAGNIIIQESLPVIAIPVIAMTRIGKSNDNNGKINVYR